MSHSTLTLGFRVHRLIFTPQCKRAFSITVGAHATEAEITSARQWLKTFDKSVIPETVGDVSYSRSSGPGGQNVNKYVMLTISLYLNL
jgi:protein subunit release factor B